MEGLNYQYYQGTWQQLPNFARLSPERKGTIEDFTIPKENSGQDFGVQYEGYIKLPKTGLYTFSIGSDDGSSLYIDGQLVVSNDGQHAVVFQTGTDYLGAGFHKIKVEYFQAGGGMDLKAEIEGPGLKREKIPSSMLFREGK